MKEFTHLHTHTEFSLLDGANQVGTLAKAACGDGQSALAITDHGNMYGALDFYNACRSEGIKPIIGCEVYVAKHSRLQKDSKFNTYNHLTLLAKDNVGYSNLLYLTSLSFIEGLSRRPRVDWSLLERYSEGIVCLSGCLSGRINEYLRHDDEEGAVKVADNLNNIFGSGNFWIELQRNGLRIQDTVNEGLVRVARKLSLPLVATNDIHYLRHEDCDLHDNLLCIATGKRKSDEKRFRFDTDDVYFKTRAEMSNVFRDLPETLRETMVIQEMLDVTIPQGKPIFPDYNVDDPGEELKTLVGAGLVHRYGDRAQADEIQDRAHEEIQVILRMGYPEYFLVVKDFIDAARRKSIPVGPGRGSAAGSIVSYALGITDVDPLKYNLIFERFLNEHRVGLPDIDIDFCKDGREEIIDYLRERHGEDRVANIITFGKFHARSAFRQAARVLDLPLRDADIIAKKIPAETSISEVLRPGSDLYAVSREAGTKEIFKAALEIEGFVSNSGIHASGIVIGNGPLYETVPLARNNKTSAITTQWDGDACEKVGLVKFDFLGLAALTIIERCQKLIESRHGQRVIFKEPFDDPDTFALFSKGDTEGVFQCFSDGMRRLLIDMSVDRFDDVVAAIALFRPGPLESGITKQYIDRKKGKEAVLYPHPDTEEYLSNTYGTMIYQEQIMQLARVLAGFDMKEADELRKAIGKKKMELLNPIKKKWLNGCNFEKKISNEEALSLWNDILKFGRYGFNLSHSVCYAYFSYYTAYLKTHYPVEFFTANLCSEATDGNIDKVVTFIRDAQKHNINVLPPDLRNCQWDYTIEDDTTIRMGLGGIKGIGEEIARKLSEAKIKGTNILESLLDVSSMTAKKNVLEALIKAGALDYLKINRGKLYNKVPDLIRKLVELRKYKRDLRAPLFTDKNSSDTIAPFDFSDSAEWTKADTLVGERDVYGFYLSGHPMEDHKLASTLVGAQAITEALRATQQIDRTKIVGVIASRDINAVKKGPNKGKKFARMIVEDHRSRITCMVFTKMYEQMGPFLQEAHESGEPVVMAGKLDVASEQPQLIVVHAQYLKDADPQRSELILPVQSGKYNTWEDLRGVFSDNPGDIAISFQVTDKDGKSVYIRTAISISLNTDTEGEILKLLE
jgi:DNA polymerase-3 subunit alpha